MVAEGQLLWTPRPEFAADSNLARYQRWLLQARGIDQPDYASLWRWSVTEPGGFWQSIWDHFDVQHDGASTRPLDRREMLGVRWFEGASVNYVEHMLRHEGAAKAGETALHHLSEIRPLRQLSWQDLGRQVRILATQLRAMGVVPGDRVVSYMPNVPETAVAMMATAAIGAVWSSAAIEFGVRTVVDRFAQIAPKVLFAADGYHFGARAFSREAEVRRIVSELPSLERVIWLPYLKPTSMVPDLRQAVPWARVLDRADVAPSQFRYQRVRARPPAVGRVLVRDDGTAETDRAQPRRGAARAPEADALPPESPAGLGDVLLQHDRLDDVEHSPRGVADGLGRRAL